MAQILIASMQPIGHVGPLLSVAAGLVGRGDRVTFLTAATHADRIRATGATPVALPAEADFDESRFDLDHPGRAETSGIKRVNFDLVRVFLAPMPFQTAALTELMSRTRFDAVIADAGFFGTLPFLLGDPYARPPVLAYTTTPLWISSRDTAPPGLGLPPSSSRLGRLRNRTLNMLAHNVLLRDTQRTANRLLDQLNARAAADVRARLGRPGRPLDRADGAGVRLPTKRSAAQRPVRRCRASRAGIRLPASVVVV